MPQIIHLPSQPPPGPEFARCRSRTILRIKYLILAVLVCMVQFAVLAWFFAPYNYSGSAEHLPKKSFLTHSLALLIMIGSGACLRVTSAPPLDPSRGLSRRAFTYLHAGLFLITLTALLRFSLPLVPFHIPVFGRKMDLHEYIVWAAILFSAGTAGRVLPMFARAVLPTAEDVLALDHRNPVLYFRSFERELSKTSFVEFARFSWQNMHNWKGAYAFAGLSGNRFDGARVFVRSTFATKRSKLDEQMVFADALSAIGPYIALGRPNESFRDMDLGAAKKYVNDEEWRNAVIDWLGRCVAVVLEAADSASLGWEIDQIIQIVLPTVVLIICPHFEGDYQSFARTHGHRFPRGLPLQKPESRLIIFNSNWKPAALQNTYMNATETLQPFFEQVRAAGAVWKVHNRNLVRIRYGR
jgi:hypothetical protein